MLYKNKKNLRRYKRRFLNKILQNLNFKELQGYQRQIFLNDDLEEHHKKFFALH